MNKYDIIRIAVAFTAGFVNAGDFVLAKDGKVAEVVIAEDAEATSSLAMTEFTNYLAKATGCTTPRRASGKVYIGTLDHFPGAIPEAAKVALAATDNYEAAWTGVVGDDLMFVGKEEMAELYAVYHFLEDWIGVRWFKAWEPDDPGEYVPELKEIVLKPFAETREPVFRRRRLDMTGSSCAYIAPRGVEWAIRAGLECWPQGGGGLSLVKNLVAPECDPKANSYSRNIYTFFKPRVSIRKLSLGGGHMTFCDPIPPKKYFAEHPEYFAMVDGVRRGDLQRYCLSNPDVQRLVADDIIAKLDLTGGKGEFLFGLMDGRQGICECPTCQALDTPTEKEAGLNNNIGTRFNAAVRNIAAMVYAKHPGCQGLTDWAYSVYKNPPETFRHDSRLWVQLCIHGRCYGHALEDSNCPKNVDRLAWAKKWLSVCKQAYTYEYANASGNYYCCLEETLAKDLKFYRSLGLIGWKEEMRFVDATPARSFGSTKDEEKVRRWREKSPSNWQWFYLAGKLTWNPELDAEEILKNVESKYYGPAYPAMAKYHALRRKTWCESKEHMGYPIADPKTPQLLDAPGVQEKLLACLAEAKSLIRTARASRAGADLSFFEHRVGLDRRWLELYWIAPHDVIKEKLKTAFHLRKAGSFDGAFEATNFLSVYDCEHTPPQFGTKVKMYHDGENFFFRAEFEEPEYEKIPCLTSDKVAPYSSDALELMLFPPSEANTYFQVVVDASGRKLEYVHTPTKKCELKSEVNTQRTAEGWAVGVKIPAASMYPLVKGEMWRVCFCRNRAVPQEKTSRANYWTTGGTQPHTTSGYHPMWID